MKIYTITTLEKIEKTDGFFSDFGEVLTFGYFGTLQEALNYVKFNNPCDEPMTKKIDNKVTINSTTDKQAEYIIIEEYEDGIHPISNIVATYQFINGKYFMVDTPKELRHICNFVMG